MKEEIKQAGMLFTKADVFVGRNGYKILYGQTDDADVISQSFNGDRLSLLIKLVERCSGLSLVFKDNKYVGIIISDTVECDSDVYIPASERQYVMSDKELDDLLFGQTVNYDFIKTAHDFNNAQSDEDRRQVIVDALKNSNSMDYGETLNISAMGRWKQLKMLYQTLSKIGFICEAESSEPNADLDGCLTLYLDDESKIPPVITGYTKNIFVDMMKLCDTINLEISTKYRCIEIDFFL